MVPRLCSIRNTRKSEELGGTSDLLASGLYSKTRTVTICNAPPYSPCSVLVRLYAAMGLHGYNLLQGKNLELSRVLRYSKTRGPPAASSYCIALDVMDPSLGLVRPFETSVSEQSYGKLSLRCNFARPHGETKKSYEIMTSSDASDEYHLLCCTPKMPPLNPFQNTNRFYLLNKSEVEENEWIRMYLDLAFAATNRGTSKAPDLSKLKIVEVAVESSDTDEGLGLGRATNAVFYIRHMDRSRARVKKNDVDRIAIVRRFFNHRTGSFSLVGQIHSSQPIPKPKNDDENPSLQSSQTVPKPKNDEAPSLVALNHKSSRTKIGRKHSGGIQKPIRRRWIGSSSN